MADPVLRSREDLPLANVLSKSRTDVNDGVEIGTFYRYELIEGEVLA